MNTPLSHEQMTIILERGRRERNAAMRELITTLPAKTLDWAAEVFQKFVRTVLNDSATIVRH